jgi:hypothetical protein
MAEKGCCGGCNELDDQVRASTLQAMRIVGAILIVLSVSEFGIGAAAHDYLSSTETYLGSWWTGLAALLTGICGVLNKTRAVAVAGVVIDVMAAAEFSDLTACREYEGITSTDDDTYGIYNICFNDDTSRSYDSCYCISSSNSSCQEYPLNSKYDCAAFMTTLPKLVKTSAALGSALAFCSLVLVSIGFSITCCTPSIAKPEKKDPKGLVDNFVVGVNSNERAF